jgi:hypothetical protein
MAMIEITTSSSMRVNAGVVFLFIGGLAGCRKTAQPVKENFKNRAPRCVIHTILAGKNSGTGIGLVEINNVH